MPAPARRDIPELLDEPAKVLPDLSNNLRDLRRLNRWFGGTALALRGLAPFMVDDGSFTMLDVATGSADIPRAVYTWSCRRGIQLDITASDVSPEILSEAERFLADTPIRLRLADARALPWPDESFDVVTCCLALHHFGTDDVVSVLREMVRVSRRAVVSVDLIRSYPAFAATWLLTRVITRNRLTRCDGPRSVFRAYRPEELLDLASTISGVSIENTCHPLFRQTLVLRKAA